MKKWLLIVAGFVALCGAAFSQNLVPVAPGDGTLTQAIADAQDGDVLQLIPDALYTESTAFTLGTVVKKNLTIEVDGDGSVKSNIQILTAPSDGSTTQFFNVGDSASLTLRGLNLDGVLNDVASASHLVTCYMGEFPAATFIKKIRIENCEIKNLKGMVINAGNTDLVGFVVVDTTIIDNCVVTNVASSVYLKYAGSNFISVTNSTFDTITSYGMRISGSGYTNLPDNTPTVIIDHTTWYNIGTLDPREIILSDKGLPTYFLNPWTLSNSIFVKMTDKTKTTINIKETLDDNRATISNICLWDVGKLSWRSHIVSDTLTADPGFADPDNGDFTLPAGSNLQTFGTDGGPIGDLRWADTVSAVNDNSAEQPENFSLLQNYPNPFNPSTTISFSLQKPGMTTLAVYDMLGRQVAVLVQGLLSKGDHHVNFSALNLTSGLYVYRLTSSGLILNKKMMVLK